MMTRAKESTNVSVSAEELLRQLRVEQLVGPRQLDGRGEEAAEDRVDAALGQHALGSEQRLERRAF